MFNKVESYQIMFILFIVTALINYYRLHLEDEKRNQGLQKVLLVLTCVLAFLSLPITLVSLGISYLYSKRQNDMHNREIRQAQIKIIDAKNAEIQSLENRIARYDSLIDSDRKRCHKEGYQEGILEARELYNRRLEREHIESYQSGYRDGQEDFPLGINRLEE